MEFVTTSTQSQLSVSLLIACASVCERLKGSNLEILYLFFLWAEVKWTWQGLCQVLLNGGREEAGEAGSEGGCGRGTTESAEVSGER